MVALVKEHIPALRQGGRFDEKRAEDVGAEEEKGDSYEPLGPAVDAGGEVNAEDYDDRAEQRYGDCVSESIGHTQPHGGSFRVLDADHVGNRRDVVVVETMAKAQ